MIENKIFDTTGMNLNLGIQDILFGISNENTIIENHITNLYIYETKWQIWKNRNSVKYGNKECISLETLYQNIVKSAIKQSKLFLEFESKQSKALAPKLKPLINRM